MPVLEYLFKPLKVGPMEIKNRVVMSACHMGYGDNGFVTERYKAFLVERAKGEVGLITVGGCYIHPQGIWGKDDVNIFDDKFIPGLRDVADAIHANGAKCIVQIIHAGRDTFRRWIGGKEQVAPSPIPSWIIRETPHELTVEEIKELVNCFAEAARRAQEAGYDGVEIQGATGFLINQFTSPVTNQRNDEYGGDFERRLRFPLEIVEAIKKRVGENFALVYRMCGDEVMEGGYGIEEAKIIAQRLQQAGIHAINTEVGWHDSKVPTVQMYVPRGNFVHLAAEIKKVVSIPVATSNRLNDPVLMDRIIAEGKADMVNLARALIADPHLAKKAKEGRLEDVNMCTACCYCLDLIFTEKQCACSVNAQTGREWMEIKPAEKAKKVMVIGSGVGGMEAARWAASRGHQVTLYEKNNQLGGQIVIAATPPGKYELNNQLNFLKTQVQKTGVKVKLNTEVTPELVEKEGPDAVIVATGSQPFLLPVPGVNGPNVITAWDLLYGKKKAQGERVVVVGGGETGCETAEHLAEEGKKVTIIEMLPRMGGNVGPVTKWVLMGNLRHRGVQMLTDTKLVEINDKGVVISKTTEDGSPQLIECDTVVMAVGSKSNNRLVEELKGKALELYVVGDVVKVRSIPEAVEEGFLVGTKV